MLERGKDVVLSGHANKPAMHTVLGGVLQYSLCVLALIVISN